MNQLEEEKQTEEAGNMPLIEHIRELRRRLCYVFSFFGFAFVVCWVYASNIFNILIMPLADIMEKNGGTKRMIFTALTEGFFTYMKVASFGAICFSFPFILWQIWKFTAPALYKKEKKVVIPFLVASPVLFIMGASLVYFFIIPLAWTFFMGFQSGLDTTVLPVELEARIGEYLSLVMTLIIAFGLCFQFPVLLVLFAYAGLVTVDGLKKFRRYAIVAIFLIAAIVTPPDVISQIGLAIPLLALYELTIIACRMVAKKDL